MSSKIIKHEPTVTEVNINGKIVKAISHGETKGGGHYAQSFNDAPITWESDQPLTTEEIMSVFPVKEKDAPINVDTLCIKIDYPYEVDRPAMYKQIWPECKTQTNVPVDNRLVEWLGDHGLDVYLTQLFYTAPGQTLKMHVDTYGIGNWGKINMSWGHADARTRWYKLKEGYDYTHTTNGHIAYSGLKDLEERHPGTNPFPLISAKPHEVECIRSEYIDSPVIVNVGVLHDVYNPSTIGRWTFSIYVREPNSDEILSVDQLAEILPTL